MRKTKILLLLCLGILLAAVAVGCGMPASDLGDTSPGTSPETSSGTSPSEETLEIGVLFDGEPAADGKIAMDYKNALAGIVFYDKATADYEPVDAELTGLTINGTAISSENYQYSFGTLEFTETYLKTLSLNTEYSVKASFGAEEVVFTLNLSDEQSPAYTYVDMQLKDVYLLGSEIRLPIASKSPASIQNISVEYTFRDALGNDVTAEKGVFSADEEGNYTYTATFFKNGTAVDTKTRSFAVISVGNTNFAAKEVVACLEGSYDDDESAAGFTGEHTLSQIEIPQKWKFVRMEYKGVGIIEFDGKTTALDSAENYCVAWLEAEDFNTIKISAESKMYIRSLTVSDFCCFSVEDMENVDFAACEMLPLWKYNAQYGTPSYDTEKNAIVFAGTGNSWPYTIQAGVIKRAYDSGYKYLVITYVGGGTTRVYNDSTGDWGGFDRNLSTVAEKKRIAYNLELAATKAEIDVTSGFSVITDSLALELYEFRFYQTDVVIEEEGIYNEANLVAEELTGKWSHNPSVSDPAVYDTEENAMSFPANGNGDTFNFEHEALRKAQKAGYNALSFSVRGSAGEISLFTENNWGRNVKFSVSSADEYVSGVLYFGELLFTEKSGIAILSSNAAGGDPVYVKEMRFIKAVPAEETDYTKANLASKELLDKWYYNSGSGVAPSYDETEGALILPANGNYDTYTFAQGALQQAKLAGYNAISFEVKGSNAEIRVFETGAWNSDALYKVADNTQYTTFVLHFAHLEIGNDSGITALVSDAVGGTALYIKELKFVKAEVSDEVMTLMTGNFATEEFLKYWSSESDVASIAYDEEKQAVKMVFEDPKTSMRFAFGSLFEYAKLFGKTKIVWDIVEDDLSGATRVRLYDAENNQLQSINYLGASKDGVRYKEMPIADVNLTDVFAIDNSDSKNSCTVWFTEFSFA